MSYRTAALIAWSLWLVVAVFMVARFNPLEIDWYVLSHPRLVSPDDIGGVLVYDMLIPTLNLAYTTVGAMMASLRPKNGVGWLCLSVGLISILVDGVYWLAERMYISFLTNWFPSLDWLPIMVLLLVVTLMLLIFPDGWLPSRRWRIAIWTGLAGIGLGAIADSLPSFYSGVGSLWTIGGTASITALLASVAAVVLRWRRSKGQERQQLKWLVYTFAVTIVAALCAVVSWYIQDDKPGAMSYSTVLTTVVALAGLMVGIPSAIGVAILKHRRYDIDLIINRTLVYGSLTATLVALYFGGIVLLQRVFVGLTGQKSTLAVVASTLVIAALFNPLRRRIQRFIDRRFYRGKYDARKTLEAFSAKLRYETDIDALSDDLVGVVRDTMQPAHVSLWLRPDSPARRSEGPE